MNADATTDVDWDYVAVGLTLLDFLGRRIDAIPEAGQVQIIDEIRMTPAGTAAAPAVIAARLGLRSRLIGAVGDDELGDVLEAAIRARGVDVGALQRVPNMRTSSTILTIGSSGERPAFHAPGASLMLSPRADLTASVTRTRCLHVGGVGTMPHLEGEPLVGLMRDARGSGAIVTCDLISPGPHTGAVLEPMLPHMDWFLPTLEEAQSLSGRRNPADVGAYFSERGVGGCVFTCGGEGALLVNSQGVTPIPPFPVDVVDTTGCGDSFCAGFAAALVRGQGPVEAAHFASATASKVASGLGSDAGVESFEQVAETVALSHRD